jgi:hypothetical protein
MKSLLLLYLLVAGVVSPTHPRPDNGFAVIELFTSEGCSSCPPADKVLADLATEYPGRVFALGFHVTYWDRLGWKDRFSNLDYTQRQTAYEPHFGHNSTFTPQAVVNGTDDAVGSDKDKLEGLVQAALKMQNTAVLEATATADGPGRWKIQYHTNVPSENGSQTNDPSLEFNKLNAALVQKTAQTDVQAGENKGNTLAHINIVRAFTSDFLPKSGSGSFTIKGPKELGAGDARLFLYAQNPATGQVLKAIEVPLN